MRALLAMTLTLLCAPALVAQPLSISPNQRYLVDAEGAPFFWLGDTAWELFHRLTREETDLYLETRAAQGFTVIQAVVLAELDGLRTPNRYSQRPLADLDPTRPNEAYFEHVDYVVNKAASLGLFIGMLPTWGDKFNKRWGEGPEVFTPQNARIYGEFLGERYRDKPVIWILGGDRIPEEDEDYAIIRAMAQGLTRGDAGLHLMTYHPMGGRNSAEFFHEDAWLDFNMIQTGHGEVANPNHERTASVYNRQPAKPVLDAEPNYEDHPINWQPANGWFDEFDSRRAGYWSMLAGALGHTYGNHNIWQMWLPGRTPISAARTPWTEALTYPGAYQAGYMRRFFESRAWWKLQLANELRNSGPNTTEAEVVVGKANDDSFVMAYTPFGHNFSLDMSLFETDAVLKIWWFDPSTGTTVDSGTRNQQSVMNFNPPGDVRRGNDWVLVVEDAALSLKAPGRR